MKAKWRKILWAVLAVQLLLFHFLFLMNNYRLDYLVGRVTGHFGLPWFFYANWKKLLLICWLFTAALILLYHYLHYLWFYRCCIRQLSMVTQENIYRQFEKACAETELLQKEKFLYCSQKVSEPFVIGFGNPILVLPENVYEEDVLYFIFLHECYHMKHHDTRYKLFMLLMQALLWFQPFMYLLKAVSFRDIEVACDEAVVKGKDMKARKAYGNALLTALGKERQKGQAYSAYFYHGKTLMKARIAAIMEEKKRWDILAIAAISFFIIEEIVCIGYLGVTLYQNYQIRQKQEHPDIYEGYEVPECFTQNVIEQMLTLPVRSEEDHRKELMEDVYEQIEYDKLPYEAEGPWQVRLKDADSYKDAVSLLLQRYLSYYSNREWASVWNPEGSGYTLLETVYCRLLAGDKKNAVFNMIFRYYVGNEEEYREFPEELKSHAQFVQENGAYYAYYNWAVRIVMVQDYVFSLEGIAEGEEVVLAYEQKQVPEDFAQIPKLDLLNKVEEKEILSESQTAQDFTEGTDNRILPYQMQINDGILQVSGADGVMKEVPVSLEELLTRGDDMDGKLQSPQEGSYQIDENKIVFAYGGGQSVPISVIFYEEESQSYKKSVVTFDEIGGRKIFVDFPENGQDGFLIFTGERVVWQESTILYRTWDGGKSWKRIGAAGPDMETESHSLTTGAVFINNRVGFVTIRDSETPEIWRTEDGGEHWERQNLPDVPQYYTMAYAPQYQEGVLTLYVGMEEYSEYGGTKAKYVSDDEGKTWQYQGIVLRK